ncbi:hypothetical protein [Aciditerrimonas ferrireducens]|uniref:hypothetical protein n=1 Tax=Aciditerrimonas ferrireducens TaxID=667306 RepID=UPI002006C2B7|nr:hypothetical protein [Aciditerrimonas ferrireducens]MCK4176152.1 hypothetical protein [Aciditerrimonas ferrireducens]
MAAPDDAQQGPAEAGGGAPFPVSGPGWSPEGLPGSSGPPAGRAEEPPAEAPSGQAAEPEGATPGTEVPITKTATTWAVVAGALVVLVVVLVFILQNLHDATTQFFSAKWTIPLGVDLLLAAVLGGLVVALVGTLRILQLRRLARRRGRLHARHHH